MKRPKLANSIARFSVGIILLGAAVTSAVLPKPMRPGLRRKTPARDRTPYRPFPITFHT
jgi:hypothetical protein